MLLRLRKPQDQPTCRESSKMSVLFFRAEENGS
ncbi:hypothetical protein FOFC_15401 [Fusarium oxysporum]|nr:hypothetical protein FOFC_15401 [Fusarium oxysporum]